MARITKSEIKSCVIQFTKVSGLEKFAHTIEPEDYAVVMNDINEIYDTTIKLYEGHVDKYEGRIFMTTFGVPIAHEEDPERAIRSALLFRKRIHEYGETKGIALEANIGMYLGKVYAGDVGSELKKEYTVMGDAVNVAARMMEFARGSQIVVSDEIFRITRPMFKFSDPIEFKAHETAPEIKVYKIVDQKSGFVRRRGIEGLISPLVGRTEEYNVLKEFFNKLLNGRGSTVLLVGEAGVGKSRLIEELFTFSLSTALEQAKVVQWCSGHCSPYKEAIYLPFIDIVKQICGIESGDSDKTITEKLLSQMNNIMNDKAEEHYPYIAHLLNIRLDSRYESKVKYLEPEAMKLQTHLAISTFLRSYALKEPSVYVFDDLYLADVSMLEALSFFLETNKDVPMLVFLLSRPYKTTPFGKCQEKLKSILSLHEINLRLLHHDATKQITEYLLHIPRLPVPMVDDIVKKAGGNPFFLEEIIKLLIAEGILYRKGSEWHARETDAPFSIPYAIEAIIRNRFDMLDIRLRSTLEEMAIIGRFFSKKLLSAFSSHWEESDDLIAEIADLGFISTENNEDYSFNHALVRDVIYSTIPEKRKKTLHRKVGETIEGLYKDRLAEFYDILFEHFSQTDRHEKTVTYGLKAAENASKRYANHEAILFYLTVLRELSIMDGYREQRRSVLIELGKIHSRIGKSDDAFEFYDRALKFSSTDTQEAEINRFIADVYHDQSAYEKAIETYDKALSKLGTAAPIEKARILTGSARAYYEKGNFQKCFDQLSQALEYVKDSSDIEMRKVQAIIFDRFGSAYYSTGKRKESFENYQKALKLYTILDDIHGQGVVYNNICDYYTGRGDYPSALKSLYKSLDIDKMTGNLLGQAIVYYNLGDTYFQLGDFPMAKDFFNLSMDIHEKVNNRLGVGYVTWGLGLICQDENELPEAERLFNNALAIFNEIGSRMWQIAVMLSIADLFILQKEYEKAQQLCENIRLIAEKNNDYDALNEIKIKKAQIDIARGLLDKKLSITHFEEAKQKLIEVNGTIEEFGTSAETEFKVYFQLCRAHYHLTAPKETMEYCRRAQEVLDEITGYMKEESMRKNFFNRALYRSFEEFKTNIKLQPSSRS